MLSATPTFAEPNIDDVQARVDSLYEQAEKASERYNDARLELTDARGRLAALDADLRRQRDKVDAVRDEVASAVVAQYQGQALSSATQVMLSDDPDTFLDQLTTISGFNDQRAAMMADFAVQAKQLEMREAAAQRELDRIAETKAQLADDKAEIDDKAAEAAKLLDRLEAERAAAAAAASRDAQRTAEAAPEAAPAAEPTAEPATANVSVSGRAGAAVSYALAQVGDAYVYGAAGPSAFDCSGLTMMAWAQAGVGLPHSSSAQMGSGTPVSQSSLAPGDLVFYYSPVSHVGIYIGNGQIVHAANPSSGVTVAPVFSMPYSGAVRPG
ncbi:C40 family peptidase [Nocardioides mesophilus]|uniref:C40 family peptidase n=1 Tax=Nocardioides mesophilus TaxID=433659 RepID=A0A7G9RGM9_9ACTN|nr:C40 family peptidase [Nocardioides mesophilus]